LVLQPVLLDVEPELLGHLAPGKGLRAGHLRQLVAGLKGLHERAVCLFRHVVSLLSPLLSETIAAIDRTVAARLEGHARRLAARGANRVEHFLASAHPTAAAATTAAAAPSASGGLLSGA